MIPPPSLRNEGLDQLFPSFFPLSTFYLKNLCNLRNLWLNSSLVLMNLEGRHALTALLLVLLAHLGVLDARVRPVEYWPAGTQWFCR